MDNAYLTPLVIYVLLSSNRGRRRRTREVVRWSIMALKQSQHSSSSLQCHRFETSLYWLPWKRGARYGLYFFRRFDRSLCPIRLAITNCSHAEKLNCSLGVQSNNADLRTGFYSTPNVHKLQPCETEISVENTKMWIRIKCPKVTRNLQGDIACRRQITGG